MSGPDGHLTQFPVLAAMSTYRGNTDRACEDGQGRELGERGDYENYRAPRGCSGVAGVRT
ncbi:hypothetical protein FJK96_13845 [Mycobacteroides chelonae]|jgi:hypothetical protein|uniref:Uncharacterized protein n=1 Tax=Mycobacteroides chelonae TaxID=1774 RepID=A0AB73U2Z5_MYCCH|nr:hypothetical protein FJK96_13845 [Mycobacteroides chelonae]